MLQVELRRHKGKRPTVLGPVEVTFDQYQILVSSPQAPGRVHHAGYVGTKPGAPINWLRMPGGGAWPEPIKQAVRDQIAEQLAPGPRKEGQPPEVQPPDDDEDDLDDDTWDEDE
jgi:hypothetical protein